MECLYETFCIVSKLHSVCLYSIFVWKDDDVDGKKDSDNVGKVWIHEQMN